MQRYGRGGHRVTCEAGRLSSQKAQQSSSSVWSQDAAGGRGGEEGAAVAAEPGEVEERRRAAYRRMRMALVSRGVGGGEGKAAETVVGGAGGVGGGQVHGGRGRGAEGLGNFGREPGCWPYAVPVPLGKKEFSASEACACVAFASGGQPSLFG